jgi:3-dehydroquinate dehydratase-1
MQRKPLFVDIEYKLIYNNDFIADLVENEKTPILISWHNFSHTPKFDDLIEQVKKMRVYSSYIKIVTTATAIDDSIKILGIYQTIDSHINLVAFAMGEMGVLSRVLCTVIGDAPFTYASVGAPLAPGQLSVDEMKSIYELFKSKLV